MFGEVDQTPGRQDLSLLSLKPVIYAANVAEATNLEGCNLSISMILICTKNIKIVCCSQSAL